MSDDVEVNKGIDLGSVQRSSFRGCRRRVSLSVKVSENVSKWMRERNVSPTALFHKALELAGCPHVQQIEPPVGPREKCTKVFRCECGYFDTENFVMCPKCEKIHSRDRRPE